MTINPGLDLGRVLRHEADFFELSARYGEAEESYGAAIIAFREALLSDPYSLDAFEGQTSALLQLAELQAKLSRHFEAYKNYRAALRRYNKILKHIPTHRETNKAIALM